MNAGQDMTAAFRVESLLVGGIAPLGPRRTPSGIKKSPVLGTVAVSFTGLEGDSQGDTRHHGGPEKAIHHYPTDHYAFWRSELPLLANCFDAVGAFGENIASSGTTERDICIGDVFRLGSATIQVSQGRQPCWRLNERFGNPAMARRVQETGWTGWYYRVLEEGLIESGSFATLIDRPAGTWPLTRLADILYRDTRNFDALAEMADISFLSESWRKLARQRLARRSIEDWSRRLETPAR